MMDYRKAYGLPERYFLSLGRMVEKKNLSTLVEAYARFAHASVEKHGAWSGEHGVRETTDTRHTPVALVFVGSGELEGALREQARGLGLRVIDRSDWKAGQSGHSRVFETAEGKLTRINTAESARQPKANWSERLAADRTGDDALCRVTPAVGKGPQSETDDCKLTPDDSAGQRGAVYFYGFRQIEENPVFYALAEAFVLASLKEEWGLVVNEAMAAGLPVIVSRTAGCAEDLVPKATASGSVKHGAGSMESGENANSDDCKLKTENSLEQRSNGFVFDPKSSDALCEALRRIADQKTKRLIDQETNGLTEMGKRSREIVAQFSCENFARQALSAARAAQQA